MRRWLETRGGERYDGEPVSHLEHALQCAALAARAGAGDALVAAALLHDIGHLASGLPGTPSA
ncbi:MAG: HD domain-containing protein, partial [Rubrivivax sp.]|nr:HD domain-containing protein [Rubrivivax sp.]